MMICTTLVVSNPDLPIEEPVGETSFCVQPAYVFGCLSQGGLPQPGRGGGRVGHPAEPALGQGGHTDPLRGDGVCQRVRQQPGPDTQPLRTTRAAELYKITTRRNGVQDYFEILVVLLRISFKNVFKRKLNDIAFSF